MNDPIDPLDQALSNALKLRPPPAPIASLDSLAVALARRAQADDAKKTRRALRLRRMSHLVEGAAMALIAMVILIVPLFRPADAAATEQPIAADDESVPATDLVSSEFLCDVVMLGALMYLALAAAWGPAPRLRPQGQRQP